ncbi:AMP-binding protein [Desulfohalovibrio reitneri]|uniref:AMP-binding protein n=1 Tax=Desulfohalovibrio reitneri TaxID=1307759 RepID=UPI0009DF1338|nr:AMP-binding protein [Desulfohalovibrio reitneri]
MPAPPERFPEVGPDDPAYCVMTSGTTGEPKGILCPHRGAVNSYFWRYEHLPYAEAEREACSIFFVWECLRPLLQGACLHIPPPGAVYSPRELVDYLAENRITRVLFTPSLLDRWCWAASAWTSSWPSRRPGCCKRGAARWGCWDWTRSGTRTPAWATCCATPATCCASAPATCGPS